MPIYFSEVAPYCPVSRDQPVGPQRGTTAPNIRTVIPRAHDLPSAIAAVNILSSIVTQLVFDKVINNVHTPPTPEDRVKDIRRHARWSEVTSSRVKRKYKYYGKDKKGNEDKGIWVMTERIEQMVWYDSGWKTYLVWQYGEKGEGEPVDSPGSTG